MLPVGANSFTSRECRKSGIWNSLGRLGFSRELFAWSKMTSVMTSKSTADAHKHGILFVFAAGVLWSTVGLGIRIIEDAIVWQILLYRSVSMSLFLYVVIRLRSGESPFAQIRRIGSPAVIAGLALVAAYSGGIYAIQNTSVANAMLLFATAPFMAAVLGWLVLREPVRAATWIAIAVALAGIAIMVADKSGGRRYHGQPRGAWVCIWICRIYRCPALGTHGRDAPIRIPVWSLRDHHNSWHMPVSWSLDCP